VETREASNEIEVKGNVYINLLAPELFFFLILEHSVYKTETKCVRIMKQTAF